MNDLASTMAAVSSVVSDMPMTTGTVVRTRDALARVENNQPRRLVGRSEKPCEQCEVDVLPVGVASISSSRSAAESAVRTVDALVGGPPRSRFFGALRVSC